MACSPSLSESLRFNLISCASSDPCNSSILMLSRSFDSSMLDAVHGHKGFPLPLCHLTLPRYTATTTKTRLRGVVFDMYRAVLGDDEYRRIKAQSPSGIDNLSHIDRWLQHQQQQAYDTIADFKRQALLHLQIMPGAADLCRLRGLITRNVKSAVDIFHERFGITFSPALSREFRPYKPDPAPQLHICSLWEVQPNEVIMIGDSLKDDGGDPNLAEVNTVPQPGTTDEAASKADDDGSSVVYVHSDATYCKKLNKGCAAGIIRIAEETFCLDSTLN
ncbi:haloacid dehalogenase-like hydrolase domain-containing protein At2g33255 [Lotus japonicus]|uniref:haloacid dehalogenase-like hydrolase domain-containing protein At2g33255 n=1 Tax=Lotus japonicus TaxID=34305 RepID=UPI0025828F71|nr:haloacid dehalogenase-like hydrolase domain-containing protein At2g33255 [Lotus japonicus]